MRSIIYTVLGVSGEVLNLLRKRLNGEKCPVEFVRDYVTDVSVPTFLKA
jgi:hypothetical protein